jgi:hypothetical protein
MTFRPAKKLPEFASLKSNLNQITTKDNALFKTLQVLIDKLSQTKNTTELTLEEVNARIKHEIAEAIKLLTIFLADQIKVLVWKVVLTNEDIKALPTTAIELVSTLGSGTRIVLIMAELSLDSRAGAYTNISPDGWASVQLGGVDVSIYLEDSSGMSDAKVGDLFGVAHLGNVVLTPLIQYDATSWSAIVGKVTGNTALFIDVPLKFQFSNSTAGDLTGGSPINTMTITTVFMII